LLQCPCHFTASNFHPVSVQASTGEASRRTHVRLTPSSAREWWWYIHFDRQGIRLPCRQPCGDSAIDRVAAQPNAALLVVRSDCHAGQAVQGKGGPEPHRASVCVRTGLRCVVARLGRGKRRPPTLLAAPSRLTSHGSRLPTPLSLWHIVVLLLLHSSQHSSMANRKLGHV
jgi:hypothetical protein